MGQGGSPGIFCLSHILGNETPENPPFTGNIFVERQFRHCIFSAVAFDDSTDAPITIPGTRTSRDMARASKSRIEISEAVE